MAQTGLRGYLTHAMLIAMALTLGHAAPLSAPAGAAAFAAGPDLTGYRLVFADEFSDGSVDTSRWRYRQGTHTYSVQQPDNVTEGAVTGSGGALRIQLQKERVEFQGVWKDYTGGGLITGADAAPDRYRFRYGYYETRVWAPAGTGWHTAFWSMCFPNCQTTEIDGFEQEGADATRVIHNAISHGQGLQSTGYYPVGFDLSAGWHTFGFLWDEDTVDFYADGVLTRQLAFPATQWRHDWMNGWLSSVATQQPDATFTEGYVYFDYFRYYARDIYVDDDGPTSANFYPEHGTTYVANGTGWGDSGFLGHGRSPVSYSCQTGASAEWRAISPVYGVYDAYIYRVGGANGDANARADVLAGTEVRGSTEVDLSALGSGWFPLGRYTINAGETRTIRLTRTADCIRADSVKFVRVV